MLQVQNLIFSPSGNLLVQSSLQFTVTKLIKGYYVETEFLFETLSFQLDTVCFEVAGNTLNHSGKLQ